VTACLPADSGRRVPLSFRGGRLVLWGQKRKNTFSLCGIGVLLEPPKPLDGSFISIVIGGGRVVFSLCLGCSTCSLFALHYIIKGVV